MASAARRTENLLWAVQQRAKTLSLFDNRSLSILGLFILGHEILVIPIACKIRAAHDSEEEEKAQTSLPGEMKVPCSDIPIVFGVRTIFHVKPPWSSDEGFETHSQKFCPVGWRMSSRCRLEKTPTRLLPVKCMERNRKSRQT